MFTLARYAETLQLDPPKGFETARLISLDVFDHHRQVVSLSTWEPGGLLAIDLTEASTRGEIERGFLSVNDPCSRGQA